MSIAICRIADLRNNNDPSVGGGRGVGSGAMTGKRETTRKPEEATLPRERRGEIPLAGLGVQERLLPTLNAVLMPSTTACLHNCSGVRVLETVSRPSLRRLSRLLASEVALSSSHPCFRRFSFALSLPVVSLTRFSTVSNYLFRLISLSFIFYIYILNVFFVLFYEPSSSRDFFTRVLLSSALTFVLSLSAARWFLIISPACIFARTRSPRLIRFLFIVVLAADADVSFEIYLSIEEIALGKGGVPASKEGKTLPPSEFRTVSI